MYTEKINVHGPETERETLVLSKDCTYTVIGTQTLKEVISVRSQSSCEHRAEYTLYVLHG